MFRKVRYIWAYIIYIYAIKLFAYIQLFVNMLAIAGHTAGPNGL